MTIFKSLKKQQEAEKIDESSLESFPASDPPSWTPVSGIKAVPSHGTTLGFLQKFRNMMRSGWNWLAPVFWKL